MKRLIILFLFVIMAITSYCQNYAGIITKDAFLYSTADSSGTMLDTLFQGVHVFIISLDTADGFYDIIYVKTNTEGFVNYKKVKVGKVVEENEEGQFVEQGEIESYNPEVEIANQTTQTLTLTLNSHTYIVRPNSSKNIVIKPGRITYRGSVPGAFPTIGHEYLKGHQGYLWKFVFAKYKYSNSHVTS